MIELKHSKPPLKKESSDFPANRLRNLTDFRRDLFLRRLLQGIWAPETHTPGLKSQLTRQQVWCVAMAAVAVRDRVTGQVIAWCQGIDFRLMSEMLGAKRLKLQRCLMALRCVWPPITENLLLFLSTFLPILRFFPSLPPSLPLSFDIFCLFLLLTPTFSLYLPLSPCLLQSFSISQSLLSLFTSLPIFRFLHYFSP